MSFCTKCGGEIPEGYGFCPYCGAQNEISTPQPTYEQPSFEQQDYQQYQQYQQPAQQQYQQPAQPQYQPYSQQPAAPQPAPQQPTPFADAPYQPQQPFSQSVPPQGMPGMYGQPTEQVMFMQLADKAKTLGIVALIFSFFIPLVTWITGGKSLSKSGKAINYAELTGDQQILNTAKTAKTLAIIGLIISIINVIAGVILASVGSNM